MFTARKKERGAVSFVTKKNAVGGKRTKRIAEKRREGGGSRSNN